MIFVKRLAAPEHNCVRFHTKFGSGYCRSRCREGLIINREVWQAHQALSVVFGGVWGLHQIAAQKVIERGKTAGFRVPQRVALNWRKPLCSELQRQLIHQKPWIDEDMRRVREDFIAPAL